MTKSSRIKHSLHYAFRGIAYAWKSQFNFKIEIILALFVMAMGVGFRISGMEWLIVALLIGLVLSLELLNTAVELLCDLYSKSYHPIIKWIKDLAAGAVLVVSITAIVIGCIIFIPRIF